MTEPKGCPTPGACSAIAEITAARKMRDALDEYETAEERGMTKEAIWAWEKAIEDYDEVRRVSEGRERKL